MFKRLTRAAKAAWQTFKSTSSIAFSLQTAGRVISGRHRETTYTKAVQMAEHNPIARRSIEFIATNLASLFEEHVYVTDGEEEVEDHPVMDLLRNPGERHTLDWLASGFVWSYVGAGEWFLRAKGPSTGPNAGRPMDLELFYPDQFEEFLYNGQGGIVGYRMSRQPIGTSRTIFRRRGGDVELSRDEMLHAFNFNPRDPERGLSILHSIRRQLEQLEAAEQWNQTLAESGGQIRDFMRPMGLEPGEQIPDETREQVQQSLNERLQEVREEDGYYVLSGAYEPAGESVTPEEASFLENSQYNGRLVALGLGIDPIVLGDKAAQTYDNYRTALRVAFTVTILPLLDFIIGELNRWLMPKFGGEAQLTYDTSEIEALQEDQNQKFERLQTAVGGPWMTPDEARERSGLEPMGLDEVLYKMSLQPSSMIFGGGPEPTDAQRQLASEIVGAKGDGYDEAIDALLEVEPTENGTSHNSRGQ